MVVENGSGLDNADSFVDIEFADVFFASRNPVWSEKTDSEKEELLVKATDYINTVFKWRGKKATKEQSLNFPRTGLVDDDGYAVEGVPLAIKQAVCEASLLLVNGVDNLFITENENGSVASERVEGAVSVSYFQGSKKIGITMYQSINDRLRGLYQDQSKGHISMSKVTK